MAYRKNKLIYDRMNAFYDAHKAKIEAAGFDKKKWNNLVKTKLYEDHSKKIKAIYGEKVKMSSVSMTVFGMKELKKAENDTLNTQKFTTAKERGINNILTGAKKFKAYQNMRNLMKDEKKRYQKVDWYKELEYKKVGDKYYWTFVGTDGKTYYLDIINSPENIEVKEVK